jgi:toxin ParE1/3/4
MKQRSYRFAPKARLELRDVLIWLCDERPGREDKFVDAFEALANRLCIFPELGRAVPKLDQSFRSIPLWNYIIFYSVHEDYIGIERILHGARDLEAALNDEDD